MRDRWVSAVFRDAADRVRRDPYDPTSSVARGTTRRATIRPVRAVRTPVVVSATPGTGRVATWTSVPVNPDDDEAHPDQTTREYFTALQRDNRRFLVSIRGGEWWT